MAEGWSNEMDAFIEALPDSTAARTFLDRLDERERLDPRFGIRRRKNPLLVSRLLTIAAYSPFLAETLLRLPEYINWLEREADRDLGRTKSTEQLSEELARFIAGTIEGDEQTKLARFKRRELLRIYLRDCLGIATLSEVTEELSNLADVILKTALASAYQEMVNKHGIPSIRDQRGRIRQAEFAITALGKLGCRELNYASDIDLLFLYAGAGDTAGDGRRPESIISNRDFFTAVAERVVQLISSSSDDGAVYRIDLRLRPYGRDGDLVWEVGRAADYYRFTAHSWERQALIRTRASAGNEAVVDRFISIVKDVIFVPEAVPDVMSDIRRAREKIDRTLATRRGGFNVKLGPGGIREVEFIVQALQLQFGGREPWIRGAQTLILLARLAEKGYLTETERARLSASYTFLRTVEHRLQMEHGAQTHTVPTDAGGLAVLARRCGYRGDDAAAKFSADLERYTSGVRALFNRIIAELAGERKKTEIAESPDPEPLEDEITRLVSHAATSLANLANGQSSSGAASAFGDSRQLREIITSVLGSAINPVRSLRNLTAWAESLATYDEISARPAREPLAGAEATEFVEKLIAMLSSYHLSHILISRPVLAATLTRAGERRDKAWFLNALREAGAQTGESTPEGDLLRRGDVLRRGWYRLVLDIGYKDISVVKPGVTGSIEGGRENTVGAGEGVERRHLFERLRANNQEQTAMAEAVLELATEIALASMGFSGVELRRLPVAIMALGRLGHAGMDYGSDLDLLIVFDQNAPWPSEDIAGAAFEDRLSGFDSPQTFYAKFTSQLVRLLSLVTREGFLYRVDLRLRPDGQSGPIAVGLGGLVDYLGGRASAWEHSAYLKIREVAGNTSFGLRVRESISEVIFETAGRNSNLKEELAAMRFRLESEKARENARNLKWGPGGMTDVYFITRYLQLRERIDYPAERGTTSLISHLGDCGALDEASANTLFRGYSFLRLLDHWIRLLLDRPRPLLPVSQAALGDLSRALEFETSDELERHYLDHTSAIRDVFNRTFHA